MMQQRENQLTLRGYWSHSGGRIHARGQRFCEKPIAESIVGSREGLSCPRADVGESYSLEQIVPSRNNLRREA